MPLRAKYMSLLLLIVGMLVLAQRACAEDGPTSASISAHQKMSREQAALFAGLALKGLHQEYPNKPADVLNNVQDVKPPSRVHPAFYGCFDWHSSVHGHWMLVRLLKTFPDLPEKDRIREALAQSLTKENLQAEADYFKQPNHQSFERMYGWSWLLKLAQELESWDDKDGRAWAANLRPLREVIITRYLEYLPKLTYPLRCGVHQNSAFGLMFAYDYAVATNHTPLRDLVIQRSKHFYGKDKKAPVEWEPDGADFLSPCLMEADLMRRILPTKEFHEWLDQFLPDGAQGEPQQLFEPAQVSDRRDPQIVHLDGLNLSRAWCMRSIARTFPVDSPRRIQLLKSADKHAQAALKHVMSGDYAGEHWLGTFAVYLQMVSDE